jgi:hypothetical protein
MTNTGNVKLYSIAAVTVFLYRSLLSDDLGHDGSLKEGAKGRAE